MKDKQSLKEKGGVLSVGVTMDMLNVGEKSNQSVAAVNVNCGCVTYWWCEAMKREVEIQQIRMKETVS